MNHQMFFEENIEDIKRGKKGDVQDDILLIMAKRKLIHKEIVDKLVKEESII